MSESVVCVRCKAAKPREDYRAEPRKLNGLTSYCIDCIREIDRVAKAKDPHSRRWKQIKRLYGLSESSFMSMWESQKGRCKICGDHLSLCAKGGFATDHNHLTGKVRGILCKPCNHGLGLFKDSPSVLEAATDYLKTQGHYGQAERGAQEAL